MQSLPDVSIEYVLVDMPTLAIWLVMLSFLTEAISVVIGRWHKHLLVCQCACAAVKSERSTLIVSAVLTVSTHNMFDVVQYLEPKDKKGKVSTHGVWKCILLWSSCSGMTLYTMRRTSVGG